MKVIFPMKYVFIDTNVFLNFYSFNKDHLDKLDKIISLIKESKISLILPRQVVDEHNRNREKKLKEMLDYLTAFEIKLNSPTTCHDFPEMKDIQRKINELRSLSIKFKNILLKQIKSKELPADKTINEIFRNSKIIEISDDLFNKAKRRCDLGNPPGKDGSYGDSVNWESCLQFVPEHENLYLITDDFDYSSDIIQTELDDFLKEEWRNKKKSQIFYYQLISEFLKENFPDIKISEKEIKEERGVAVESAYNRYSNMLATITKPDLSAYSKTLRENQKAWENIAKQITLPVKLLEETQKRIAQSIKQPISLEQLRENQKAWENIAKQITLPINLSASKKKSGEDRD